MLDEATIAQIAAGEVIERPVSVVKELVENSLDAGAKRIDVELASGGRTVIAVSDDGAGIEPDDLPLAFARHATSKLASVDDLFAIRSLGFRGEGLASIAAAGTVELTSRTRSSSFGVRVDARGTSVRIVGPAAAPPGTKVVVRDLFALTPARREFLKSARAESARVSAFLTQIALGWPRVAFSFRHDGRDVWSLPAVADPIDRLESVFGASARGALADVADADDAAREKVRGYVSRPGHDRPNRNGQVFFVNGRLVRSAALSAAWLSGYGSSGMTGRYPFGAVAVSLPPEDVDVNVHPTKSEVRFAFPSAVFESVRRAVARTMRVASPIGVASRDIAPVDRGDRPQRPYEPSDGAAEQISFAQEAAPKEVRALGQIDRTYILIADGERIVVVDQHAAHERIAFEALLAGAKPHEPEAPLLFPAIVKLTPDRASAYHEFERDLHDAGFGVEPFGDDAVRIRTLPAGYDARRLDVAGILDDLAADDAPREGVAHRRRVLATIACHSVVRAGEALSLQEQSALYERLLRCTDPQTCPHGRPTTLEFDGASLAKAFKRA